MIVFDAHAHLGSDAELTIRREAGVRTVFSCGNPQQARQAEAVCRANSLFTMTAGIHPWYAQTASLSDMAPFMERAAMVGEIGMDCVWCDVPLSVQRAQFTRQLDWAQAHGKGIVLHTKGCEREIAERVQGFPHPIVVHWYSGGEEALADFLRMDCYFTIGPDVPANVAQRVPDERILFETDGMDAVRWALGDIATDELPRVLERSVRKAAALRGQDAEYLAQKANENYLRLFHPREAQR